MNKWDDGYIKKKGNEGTSCFEERNRGWKLNGICLSCKLSKH